MALAWLIASPLVAQAQSALYAVDGSGGVASTLYRLDPRDGSVLQKIGPIGFNHVTGLAFHPVTRELYGVSSIGLGNGTPGTGELIRIDPVTGAGTAIGLLNLGSAGVPDMAFAPSGQLYVWSEASDELALVDITTGAASAVGPCGFGTGQTGLAIDEAGNAIMKAGSQLYSVDRITGACTPRANLSNLDTDSVLAVDEAGRLYTADRQGGTTAIATIDPTTGIVTLIGSNDIARLSALAFEPPPPSPLYAVDGAGGVASTLYRLDPRDGSVLQTIGPIGFNHVTGLAFHPVTGELYGVSSIGLGLGTPGTGELIRIDPKTGAGTAVGLLNLGPAGVPDMAFAPSGQLYVWTEDGDNLALVDLATGAGSVVGVCGPGTAHTGLAIDEAGRAVMKSGSLLYAVDRVTGACTLGAALGTSMDNILAYAHTGTLYTADRQGGTTLIATADPTTGVVTPVGSNAIAALSALAFKPPPLPPLYAVDGAGGANSTLYRLDPRDGSVLQTIGPIGFNHVTGLAFHPVTGELYGVSSIGLGFGTPGTGELIRIDPKTGAGTAVGLLNLGPAGVPDMAFAPSGQLYVWTEDGDNLALVDLATGAGSVVGVCGPGTARTGLAIDEAGRALMKSDSLLYSVDRVTGTCTFGATLGADTDSILTYATAGRLYTADRQGGTTMISTVDPTTGSVATVGSNAIANLSALAFKPPRSSNLYAADGAGAFGGTASSLYLLDPDDGSLVAELGPIGFTGVTGLAFHPITRALYAFSRPTFELLRVDPVTGAGAVVGSLGGAFFFGLPDASFAPSGQLYVWDESDDDLALVDPATGAGTVVGECGFGTAATGLAIDDTGRAIMKNQSQLYAVDRITGVCTPGAILSNPFTANVLAFDESGTLYTAERQGPTALIATIDPSSGLVTPVGSNPVAFLSSLAFEPRPLPPLYAADGAGGVASTLYRLDPRDGSVLQTIGPIGFEHVTGLAFHPVTRALFGVSSPNFGGTGELLEIDLLTGAGAAVGPVGLGVVGYPDMAFAPSGQLYVWSENTDELARVDFVTGAGTVVGPCGFGTAATGLAIDDAGNTLMKTAFQLYAVDRLTGACTPGPALSTGTNNILSYSHTGTYFTAARQGGTTMVATADPTTGTVTQLGSNSIANLSALSFEPVPEPSGLAMLVAGMGGLLGVERVRRRRRVDRKPDRPRRSTPSAEWTRF